jgi:hypothetical protein
MPRSLNKKTIQWEDLEREPGRIYSLTQRPISFWTPTADLVPPKRGLVGAKTLGESPPLNVTMPVRFARWWNLLAFSLLCWRRTTCIYWEICSYICGLGTAGNWLSALQPLVNGQSQQWKWVCFEALVKSANRYNWYLNALGAVIVELGKPSPNRKINGKLRGKTYPVFLEYIVRERWDLYDPDGEVESNRLCAQYDPFANRDLYGVYQGSIYFYKRTLIGVVHSVFKGRNGRILYPSPWR